MNAPCFRQMAQSGQKVSIPTFRQDDVGIAPVEGIHHALHPVWASQWNHLASPTRCQTDGLNRRQADRHQASILQRTVPISVQAKHPHVVHDVRARPRRECILNDPYPTKEFDVIGGQPRLHRIDVHRQQGVMPMKATVVDGAGQTKAVAWTAKRHLKHRVHGTAERHWSFDGVAGKNAMVQPDFGLVKPDLKSSEPLWVGGDVKQAGGHKTQRASGTALLAHPNRKHTRAFVVHVEQPARPHPVPPRHLPRNEDGPRLRAGPSGAKASKGHGQEACRQRRGAAASAQADHRTPPAHREATSGGTESRLAIPDPHAHAMSAHFDPCHGHAIWDGGGHGGRGA